jgi:hypothetical protein
MEPTDQENQTLQEAITARQGTAGFKTVKVDVRPIATNHPAPRADAVLTITLNGYSNSSSQIRTIEIGRDQGHRDSVVTMHNCSFSA